VEVADLQVGIYAMSTLVLQLPRSGLLEQGASPDGETAALVRRR